MLSDSHSNVSVHRSSRTSLYSSQTIIKALRLIWVALILFGELGTVYWTIARCRWPSIRNSAQTQAKPTHVLLLSDTQVQARPLKSGTAFSFQRLFFDLTLRKHWRVASNLNPDVVIFLGDMLANGKGAHSREEYDFEVRKFKSIFWAKGNTTFHYVPGNEDVGLGSVASVSNNLRSYFTANFGPVNSKFVIANHTFVGLDSPGLVDEDYHRHASHITFDDWKPVPSGPVEFVRTVSNEKLLNIILLSHIPLSRSETTSCGPNRERGSIRRTAGPGYQSMLGKHTTSFLLKALNPLVVFSGDNHDYCDYIHVVPGSEREASHSDTPVREVTVKSFSVSPHIKRPGFQLLTLIEPTQVYAGTKTYSDGLCLLPDQHAIYSSVYFPVLFLTFAVLLIQRFRKRRSTRLKNIDTSSSFFPLSRGTATLQAEPDPGQLSATWSPYSPMLSTSPRASFPSDIRTPRSPFGSTARLVASVPGSPAPSSPASFHVPLHAQEDGSEEEDLMYPSQYITHRDSYSLRQRSDDEWSHVRDEEDASDDYRQEDVSEDSLLSPSNSPEFNSSPPQKRRPTSFKSTWSWSYTFVLKGRRRRLSLSLPSLNALNNLLELIGISNVTLTRKRKHGTPAFALSMFSVIWPAAIIWTIVNGFFF